MISQITLGNCGVISCKFKDLAGVKETATEKSNRVHHFSEMSTAFP